MVYNIAVCVTYFFEMFIAYIFFSQIGDKKVKTLHCFVIGTAIFETGAIFNIVLSNIILFNALYLLFINFLYLIICFKIKISRILFYALILDIASTALEFVSIFIISVLTGTQTTAYLNNILFYVLNFAISKLLYFLTCLIIVRFVKTEKANFKFPIGLYFYPLAVISGLIIFWDICSKSNISNKQQIALSILSAVLFASIITLFISYQRSIENENNLMLMQNELERANTDKNYYNILEKQNEELMIYAHDAKKHLSAIQELNNNPEIDKYIVEMTNRLKAHSNTCHSGNHTLDVIINKYDTECKIKNIDFSFDFKLANLKMVDDYDLVTVISNLLDNALEASVKSDKRYIKVKTNKVNTYDSLIITNSCDIPPNTVNHELRTTKKDKKVHGLGIKSVLKTLKKYDGDLEWEYNDKSKEFITTVIFLNK